MTVRDFVWLVSMGLVLALSFAAVFWIIRRSELASRDRLFSVAWRAWGIWLFTNLIVLLAFAVLESKRIIPAANTFWKTLFVLTAMFAFSTFANVLYLRFLINRSDEDELSVVPVEVVRLMPQASPLVVSFFISVAASGAIFLVLLTTQLAWSGYNYYFPPSKPSFEFYDI